MDQEHRETVIHLAVRVKEERLAFSLANNKSCLSSINFICDCNFLVHSLVTFKLQKSSVSKHRQEGGLMGESCLQLLAVAGSCLHLLLSRSLDACVKDEG